MSNHLKEIERGERFEFGKNWARFLEKLDDGKIAEAERALRLFLGVSRLENNRFLDLGSGSGLSSLAARRLGAQVTSVDYDPHSVACTRALKKRFFSEDTQWKIFEGSALDASFLHSLGKFEVVYSWGVLHHTGSMWEAIRNASDLVETKGLFYLSIYNDQGAPSKKWLWTKKTYNRLPSWLRFAVLGPSAVRLWGPTTVRDFLRGRPFETWRAYGRQRGMSPWEDVVDWVGGLPFEVAKPEEILDFLRPLGFNLIRLKTCAGGLACNEFLFQKI